MRFLFSATAVVAALWLSACGDGGGSPDEPTVGDAVAVVVTPDLDVSCLTVAQLRQLQAQGPSITDLASIGRDAETLRPLPAGPATFFGAPAGADARGARIAEDQRALGLIRLSAFLDDHRGLDLVSVDSGTACVPATEETAGDGSYPLLHPPRL